MKKSTMKKFGSMILACLMIVSTFAAFSTATYAESDSYKTKIHEAYLELDPEELATLTADPTTYDISVFIEFVSSAEELAALYSDDPTERRENGKNYHSNKNKKLKEALELENAYVSNLAPFAEIQFDSIEEYEASWKQIRSIAKSKDVKDIEVSITNLQGENLFNLDMPSAQIETESTREVGICTLNYTLSDVYADVGIEDNEYTGDGVIIGVLEVALPDSTDHIPEENYFSYVAGYSDDPNAPLHATVVTSLIGGYYGIAKDATIICAATGETGFLDAVEYLIGEEYVQLVNMSAGVTHPDENDSTVGYTGYYDNWSAYIDYLSYQYGCLFVKSAGNRGEETDHLMSIPACSANTITVGAMNKNYKVSKQSSFAYFADGILKPDMVAPGENVVLDFDEYSIVGSGTSLSTPIVTGIAARLMEEFDLTSTELKAILIQSCEKLPNQVNEHDTYAGAGLVNYTNARQIAESGNYGWYTKSTSTADGAILGTRTISIPANSELHLYFFAQCIGGTSQEISFLMAPVNSSVYHVGIAMDNGITYYANNHIVITNSSNEAIPCVILVRFTEDKCEGYYEWCSIAYDFSSIS